MADVPSSGEASLPLPERFGRYRIIKRLGAGGMGSVYLAKDTQLGRQVALKVPHLGPADGPEVRQRFFREARTAATLDLGVILYELLTGELPFRGTGLAVVGQILIQEPLPLVGFRPDVDPRLEAICRKAMAKKVEDRYGSMGMLATALGEYLRPGRHPEKVELGQV